jgi:hypothetical protein
MKLRWIGLAFGTLLAMGAALSLPSCGHDRKLESITVQPQTFTFLVADSGQTTNYTAYGTYIHPPSYQDITNQVTWAVQGLTSVVTIGPSTGTITTQGGCGVSGISATAPEGTGGSENIIVGYGTVTVDNPDILYCPGGSTEQATLIVILGGTQQGVVTSIPAGATCPGPCGAQFNIGSLVGLNATPNTGHTFLGWENCTAGSGDSCSLTMPAEGVVVTATFD